MTEYVYFAKPVGLSGPIKIGWSNSPQARLSGLMTWSPLQLELVAVVEGGRSLEKNIHECFADDHSHREWFKTSPRLVAALDKIKAGVPVDEAIDLSKRIGRIGQFGRKLPKRSPDNRLLQSYHMRFYWAKRKAEEADERDCWFTQPDYVCTIMDRWSRTRMRPPPEDIARLDHAIATAPEGYTVHIREPRREAA